MRFIEKTEFKLSVSNGSDNAVSTSKIKSVFLLHIRFCCWLFLLQQNDFKFTEGYCAYAYEAGIVRIFAVSFRKFEFLKNFETVLKNFRATLFSGQALVAQKSWMMKKYFNTVKYSRATLFFRASASCSKILNLKSILNINTVKNSRATLFFRANSSCSKILNLKSIFHTVKIFRASASCSKILNSKKYIQYSVKF